MIEANFQRRIQDVNEIYQLLQFLLSIETHKGNPLKNPETGEHVIVTQEMQCIAKAQFLIVLYNLVESTVCDCLNGVYDTIWDDHLVFQELSDEMKKMWRNYLRRKNSPEASKSEEEMKDMPIKFDTLAMNISGSLDFRKIQEVFSKHGCLLDTTSRETIANSFLVVKNKRNSLAHGNVSFSACGSNYLLSDLLKFKVHIVDYMGDVVERTNKYISNGKYRFQNVI